MSESEKFEIESVYYIIQKRFSELEIREKVEKRNHRVELMLRIIIQFADYY